MTGPSLKTLWQSRDAFIARKKAKHPGIATVEEVEAWRESFWSMILQAAKLGIKRKLPRRLKREQLQKAAEPTSAVLQFVRTKPYCVAYWGKDGKLTPDCLRAMFYPDNQTAMDSVPLLAWLDPGFTKFQVRPLLEVIDEQSGLAYPFVIRAYSMASAEWLFMQRHEKGGCSWVPDPAHQATRFDTIEAAEEAADACEITDSLFLILGLAQCVRAYEMELSLEQLAQRTGQDGGGGDRAAADGTNGDAAAGPGVDVPDPNAEGEGVRAAQENRPPRRYRRRS